MRTNLRPCYSQQDFDMAPRRTLHAAKALECWPP